MRIKTDADLAKWVAETPKVKSLDLYDTQVVDLSPLAGLTNLEVLDLCDTQVVDLSPLAGLTNLEVLNLRNTQVDQQSLDNLRAALPNVRIYR